MMRPKILKEAAAKHNLFLAEDGGVLEIFDDDKSPKKKRAKKGEDAEENGNDGGGKKKVWANHSSSLPPIEYLVLSLTNFYT